MISVAAAQSIASSSVLAGSLGSLAAGLLTAVGAVPLFFVRRITERTESVLLGFAAGVMLAASFFSLILPGIESLETAGLAEAAAAATMAGAVLLGATAIGLLSRYAAIDFGRVSRSDKGYERSRHLSLFLAAITLHNFLRVWRLL